MCGVKACETSSSSLIAPVGLIFYRALSGHFWIGECDKTSKPHMPPCATAAVQLNTIIGQAIP
jgi:hypothetical protein